MVPPRKTRTTVPASQADRMSGMVRGDVLATNDDTTAQVRPRTGPSSVSPVAIQPRVTSSAEGGPHEYSRGMNVYSMCSKHRPCHIVNAAPVETANRSEGNTSEIQS